MLAGLWSAKSRQPRDRAARQVCSLFQVHPLGRSETGQRLSRRSAKSQAVFYDVSGKTVEILAIVAKSEAESWLAQFADPE